MNYPKGILLFKTIFRIKTIEKFHKQICKSLVMMLFISFVEKALTRHGPNLYLKIIIYTI